ncbi:uncharacterized protein ARB_06702 [Trichophyton benhamiae CBS 112371]|uniref:Atos-like conserved domain-containing protein n=1 Tax=Arthroderma benhamiae (strain ATCC MYA-4681 / CBS 112371) TaxID=663331 RepID=D4ARG0_ARTBC|nr:uncharacterized protein ARB_06702 [Trichophyton benhamiae CBS 112371]EFE34303.1 hypothetical protein ARB_06702 [Trichophyton benhamiae CBS 112371]
MPIFQDPEAQGREYSCWSPALPLRRPTTPQQQQRQQHLQHQQDHEQPELADEEDEMMLEQSSADQNMESACHGPPTSSREELIRRIKDGQSPTWIPNRAQPRSVWVMFWSFHTSPLPLDYRFDITRIFLLIANTLLKQLEEYFATHGDSPLERLEEKKRNGSPLLPSVELERSPDQEAPSYRSCGSPVSIERPRSALHSGDFREGSPKLLGIEQLAEPSSCVASSSSSYQEPGWVDSNIEIPPAPLDPFASLNFGHRQALASLTGRSRAPSLGSVPSSYVLKAPTSPLVIQANNPDLDFSVKDEHMDICSTSSEKANRRRTLPPETFRNFPSSSSSSSSYYQAHQPRRSITSMRSLQMASSPQGAGHDFLRPRRPSQSAEASPLHHASMVGSFEESILRGRMSTNPSKPLDFTAEIGVLGKGNCKSNLRCPPHVMVPFPAVFYSYSGSASGKNIADDSPSPYVGFIDLENSLPAESRPATKKPKKQVAPRKCPCHPPEEIPSSDISLSPRGELRAREKRSRRSQSPKSPPGGCYRIPQQGQLQIIIKNPNKTAVKLFLVPYDLEGMEPGTKTFIRQRSYSTGPAVDIPQASTATPDPQDKPVLRYLIHINICCPSRGRFYLYSGIRAVFANRVPDGKEKLRNELQYPEPRFSTYKLSKESARFAAEKAQQHRRRSSGIKLGNRDREQIIPTSSSSFTSQSPQPTSAFQLRPPSLHAQMSDPLNLRVDHGRAKDQGNPFPSPLYMSPTAWHMRPTAGMLDTFDGISDAPSTSPRSKTAPFTSFTPRPAQDVQQQQQQQEQSIPLPPIQNLQLPPLSNSRPSSRSSNAESLLSLKLRDLNESSPPSP